MMFSMGCHAVWRIFLLKSRLSTLISSFFLLPPVHTLRGFRMARGLLLSLDASKVTSRRVLRSNILKKLLYDPVMIALPKTDRKHQAPSRGVCSLPSSPRQPWPSFISMEAKQLFLFLLHPSTLQHQELQRKHMHCKLLNFRPSQTRAFLCTALMFIINYQKLFWSNSINPSCASLMQLFRNSLHKILN